MIAIQGLGVSAGIVEEPLQFYKRDEKELVRKNITDTEAEKKRYEDAKAVAIEQLEALREKALTEAGEEAALLFETHQMMLEDLDFVEAITGEIDDEKVNAEAAVDDCGKQFAEMFAAMDDEYMQARSADVRDISTRLINILSGKSAGGVTHTTPAIIAADDLTPSETVQLDKKLILGFVMAAGSGNSHTAILARTMGIPAIVGATKEILKPEYEGRTMFIDGRSGKIIIDPDDAARKRLEEQQERERAMRRILERMKGQDDVTADGKEIKLYCNIGSPADVDAVLSNDARGIGLFRSEFLYLETSDYPTEDAQFEAYKTVAQRMNGQRVIIRTLDIGADKQVGYFDLPKEENPAMGMRAIRICLTRPEVFKTQLRALYRASAYGKIAIMFPMITSVWEVREIKRICAAVRAELRAEGVQFNEETELGIMIETPAAVMVSDRLAHEVDFFSVGTNDLTQYTLAVDRQGQNLERFFDAHHTAVLRMLKIIADNAHKAGIWAGICGELASDATLTETFLAIGIDELSVSPSAVLPMRSAIRAIDTQKNRHEILDELAADSAAE